jgi:hypothetical protein
MFSLEQGTKLVMLSCSALVGCGQFIRRQTPHASNRVYLDQHRTTITPLYNTGDTFFSCVYY